MAGIPLTGGAPASLAVNAGEGPHFDVLEVGHPDYVALIEGEAAFWALAPRREALDCLLGAALPQAFREKEAELKADLDNVRFRLVPAAVYFNPTERCNLNCSYCYLPEASRRQGMDMSPGRLLEALARLADYFQETLPEGIRPQVVFHGSEPLLVREAVFQGIETY